MGFVRLDIEPHRTPSARKIARAVDILHGGGVAAYPTDSVYALGCAIEARRAVEKIYRAKQMDKGRRLALICPDLSTASEFAHFPQTAFRLARRLFPGPYTLVVPASREVPRNLLDKKRRSVGIRIPDHPVTQALVRGLGRPLLTTSAVAPGADHACRDADEIEEAFGPYLDVLVDSGLLADEPSTVIEVTDDVATIIREGAGPTAGLLD